MDIQREYWLDANENVSREERCPLCGSPLVLLRDESRCCRCFFRQCESCDGAPEPDG